MRYDTPVTLVSERKDNYDASTGNYVSGGVDETIRYASVMDAQTETLRLIFGQIRQGVLTVHFQNHITEPFDYMVIRGRRYGVDYKRDMRLKSSYIVSEMQ